MLSRGIVVIDFETTGLTAGLDRVIEVGAAVVCDGKVVDCGRTGRWMTCSRPSPCGTTWRP